MQRYHSHDNMIVGSCKALVVAPCQCIMNTVSNALCADQLVTVVPTLTNRWDRDKNRDLPQKNSYMAGIMLVHCKPRELARLHRGILLI